MAGVLPFVVGVSKRPQGHGYTVAEVERANPYFMTGQILRGHEFHYSSVQHMDEKKGGYLAFKMRKGQGIMNGWDGFCYKNVLATYTHLHALGTKEWARGIVKRALACKEKNLLIN
jgi:cobyrinic acid a,c-diamide synthase